MKQAVVLLSNRLKREKIEHKFCVNCHDEWQIECGPDDAETVGKYGVQAITDAGILLKMRCPLTGEYKIGTTWRDTH
jgi:DNA polymerase-1